MPDLAPSITLEEAVKSYINDWAIELMHGNKILLPIFDLIDSSDKRGEPQDIKNTLANQVLNDLRNSGFSMFYTSDSIHIQRIGVE